MLIINFSLLENNFLSLNFLIDFSLDLNLVFVIFDSMERSLNFPSKYVFRFSFPSFSCCLISKTSQKYPQVFVDSTLSHYKISLILN